MSDLREAIRDVYLRAYHVAQQSMRSDDAVDAAWEAVEAYLREHDAQIRQRIEALDVLDQIEGDELVSRDAVLEAIKND